MRNRFGALTTVAVGAALVAAIASPPVALAHVELESSTPADGATLTEAPAEVRLVFSGELSPDGTALTVTDESGATVGGGELDLEIAERNEVAGAVEIAESGSYRVAWSAASLDGHVEEGVLTFTVELESDSESPDTAVGADDGRNALVILGLALLLVGLGLGRRRWFSEVDRA
ncbi:MAG: copper resistance protein CopC [Chloroflexi bacterium]|nr:copper resistance protein CopC [Chloroflexota bacterium]